MKKEKWLREGVACRIPNNESAIIKHVGFKKVTVEICVEDEVQLFTIPIEKIKKPTQETHVIEHLKREKTITYLEALECYGIGHLAKRIHNLKNEGWHIESNRVQVTKAMGGTATIARYEFKW